MAPRKPAPRRRRAGPPLAAAVPAAAFVGLLAAGAGPAPALENPVLGQAEAIAEGRRLYRTRCVSCHGEAGGRGPNLFATRLAHGGFLEVVINGRKGSTMPAFGQRMSPDEVWQVHAYVKSTDRYR